MRPLEERFRTRGQPSAVAAIGAMLATGIPHAILLVGPGGTGKTTLAEDLAAALLCIAPDPADRPCRTCRACRAVEHGNHPDLHRLAPTGAGAMISIGGRGERGVRDLATELALLPVEAGARVAIVEGAHRMSEDAQSAFLKTLEEPPAGTVLILCADDEERLLPTIRSRCARVRLGPVPARVVERLLADRGDAEPPLAGRAARLAGGRPGMAASLARRPELLLLRGEIARTLLDLARANRAERLRGVRDLAARAAELGRPLGRGSSGNGTGAPRGRGRATAPAAVAPVTSEPAAPDEAGAEAAETGGTAAVRVPAAERRAAAIALVELWRDLARDLALVELDERPAVRDHELIEDLAAANDELPAAFAARQLRRLELAGERLEGNVSPELVLDWLALGWGAR